MDPFIKYMEMNEDNFEERTCYIVKDEAKLIEQMARKMNTSFGCVVAMIVTGALGDSLNMLQQTLTQEEVRKN